MLSTPLTIARTRQPLVGMIAEVLSRLAVFIVVVIVATPAVLVDVNDRLPTPFATALNFAIVGDFGLGGKKYAVMSEMRSSQTLNQVCASFDGGCNFTLSMGDNMYCPNVAECLIESFEKAFETRGPVFPSIGNHDNWPPQVEFSKQSPRWKFVSRWYTFKLPIDESGYTVQIYAVDATDGSLGGGAQLTWLENELKNSNARWKIVFGHYPNMGSGRHKRVGTVNTIHPLLVKYDAQAYFCGHDHILEMNVNAGRMYGISGAMSRGGMLQRFRGGGGRVFSLTAPNEYSPHAQDWPQHGFFTAQLSPNVLTVQSWDNAGGMIHEVSLTYNWASTTRLSAPAALQNMFPPPDVVRAAYEDEKKLAKGPGGGTAILPGGQLQRGDTAAPPPAPTSSSGKASANASTPVANSSLSTSLASTTTTTAPLATMPMPVDNATLDFKPVDRVAKRYFAMRVTYMVSAECSGCSGRPTIGRPFTLFVNGLTLDPSHRIFLTTSSMGCGLVDHILDGTVIRQPSSNALVFRPNVSTATVVYVCLSNDRGRSYARLERRDTVEAAKAFVIQGPSTSSSSARSFASLAMQQQSQQRGDGIERNTLDSIDEVAAAAGGVASSSSSSSGILGMMLDTSSSPASADLPAILGGFSFVFLAATIAAMVAFMPRSTQNPSSLANDDVELS